ncbi:ATP-binding protein [Allokutzneria sp. A3M-2-11 16]|uniref:ATP-binding protein n=1 Tax=Allokutzneria sp. A3M-2-11 16 TaxID=2962043 RepID=UPI0020B85844|nr:ATP-binding protein [Allokutzneria sp. A3M-2-11 16]MCP3797649.1 ATP-binding protein [Allokutzneria sp. A3M-2-11 16]
MTVSPSEPAMAEPTFAPAPIEVRVSANAAHLSVVRAVAADLAMREDFDLDSIADLKLAVDEACSTLIGVATRGAALSCRFSPSAGRVVVDVSVLADEPHEPKQDTFGWRVLSTLADEVTASTTPADSGKHLVRIELSKASGTVVGA